MIIDISETLFGRVLASLIESPEEYDQASKRIADPVQEGDQS